MDRTKTNEYVWEQTKQLMRHFNRNTEIRTIIDNINIKRMKLLGHIVRAANNDPRIQVTLETLKPPHLN